MEEKAEYITKEELEEGLAMFGKGYEDQPSVVVEPPRRRIERRGKQMMEVEEAAFVKFSTAFKSELADLDVYALKVFIYIGLSINFETGTAFPGVRKIAKDTRMNKDTVAKAIEELEEKGFLQVSRRDGASNVYKPECYFAIGETVPSGRTPHEPSGLDAQLSGVLSDENAELSDGGRVKRAQPDKQEIKPEQQEAGRHPLFDVYETHLGALTTAIADWLIKAEKQYSFDWVVDALSVATKATPRPKFPHLYCGSILERWKREGKSELKKKGQPAAVNPEKYKQDPYREFYA